MPRDLSVRSALDLIASSKITERQEGLELLTEICSNANNCRSLQNTPDGTGWLQVFQCMFVLVKTERSAALKGSKTSKAAISRLQVAAGKVRWLVEVSYPYLTNKPLVALYTHLNQSIVHDGGLVEYISTDYIKALKVLLSFPAHLEHLDETTWRYLMSIVWDVVLDGRVEHDRDEWDAEAQETFETAGILAEDESEDEGGTMKPRPGSSAVKRTRTSKSTGSSDLGTLPRRKYKTLSADATDLLSLFPVLLSSSSAPILPRAQLRDPDDTRLPHRAGIPLLRRVFAFFERYPSETNSHKPVLQGLNILLRELELNAINEMTRMGARMFPLLVKLWSTRDLTLRDHVLVALRKFAPFLSREKQRSAVAAQLTQARSLSQSAADTDGDSGILGERMTAPLAEAMHELQNLIFKDAGTKRGTLPLDLAALHLRLSESDTGSKPRLSLEDPTFPLQSSIIRAGPSFTARLTASWATLELNADCCFKLHQVPDTVENSRLVGSAPATKRIKKNDRTNPILALAPFVQTSRQPESRLLALQTLYFVIERHWSDLFLDVQAEILSQLLSLTKDSDLNIQQWTFVCLASVSTKRRLEASREFGDRNTAINGTVAILNRTGDEESIWQEVWTIALRRTNLASGTACRGACLMVHALMLSGTVTDASISTALSGFFEEIISQGPAYTSDAVCAFVKVALDYAERDTKLYRLDHHQKVIAWFRYNWRVAQDIRTGTNAVSTSLTPEAVELLAKVAGSSDTPTMWIETPLIASDVLQHMTEELETSPIRQYLLYAALPIEQASRSTKHRFPLGVKLDTLEGTATQSNLKKTRQILELLHDTVKDVSTTIDLASALKMKNLIDLSIFAILVSAVITSSQEDPEHIAAETACDLLERVLAHTFKESNHGAHERAMILSSLTPILSSSGPRRVRDSRSEMWPTLTLPDGRAGVTTLPSSEQPEALDHSDHPLTDRLLVTVWRIARLSEVFQAHAGLFRQYLASGQGSQGLRSLVGDTTRQGDDDFGPIRQEEDGGVANDGDVGENLPFTRGYSIVVRALTDPAYYASGMQIGTRDVELYNILIESEEYNTYILGQAIFEAIGEQRLVLTRKALSSLVELVTDVLKIYVYKRLPATRQLVYQFLSATLYTWIDVEESVASAAEELLPLWHWCSDYLTTGKLDAWQDRYRIITLFDEVVLRDPSETRWLAEGMTDGERETPSQVMLRSLEDCDIRVRFRLATSVPRLLQLDMPIASKPSSFYLKVARYFRFQGRDKEFILSRAILMTNVVIASSGARRAPFFHLYDTVAGHPSLHTHIETAFSAITRLLQLASFSRLYLEYATRLLAAQGREDQDPLHIPVSLYGFQSRAVWARETIGTAGASLLLSPECEGFWESLVELAQVDKADTLHHNVSTAIAMAAGMKALADADGQAFRAELARLKARFSKSSSRPKSKWVFQKSETASMVATVFQLADESISPAEIHQSFLQGSAEETVRQATIYKALLFPNDYNSSMDLEETITPKNSAREVLRGIQLLANEFDLDLRLIACNTIMQIMCKISASCLLNERRRLVYSLALLIATYPDTIMEPEIFDLLLRAVACLYEQPDLGRLMVSFLAWILEQLLDGSARCKAPVPVLSGLAKSAKRYTEGPKGFTSTGHDALSLMETFMNRLLREDVGTSDPWKSKLGQQIARLLPLWPRTLPEGLERKVSRLTYGQLRDQASHTDVTAGKFTLSKQLARFAQARLPASAYRKSTFWHLRSSIASAPELSHEDMEAFMLLAYTCDGLAEIPTHETIEKLKGSAGVEIGLLQPLGRKSEPTAASKRRILSLLLDDMRGTSLTRVSPAYRALAGICATAPEIHQSAELDPVSQGQLTLLASNVPSPRRDALKMDDLTDATLDRGPYAESHKDAKGWSSDFGRLIVQELASAPAYAALSYLLDIMTMSDELIDDLIPPLLHLLLDLEMRTTPQQAPNRQIISGYFNWLLARKETARSCSLNIVHSVLYLRNFSPAQSTIGSRPLAWLELDLRAVSVAALRCKLPETALLFWELHRDGASDNSELEEGDLSLLYEIYDSVEEPDGFYGVPLAGDARSAVLKRLHHEEDWTQAFSYHGASFEISDARNGALPLVARSLRAFGFDTLAGTLLREVANDGGHMPLDLAWRTRQWDVPVEALVNSAAERPGASVYRTLRSVHHARDTSQAWSVARTALSEAFNTFGSIGVEDMAGIRQGLKTLLCLREVDLWFADLLPLVHLEDFAHDKWRAFRTLPANMEYPMADDILNVRLSLLHAAKASEGPQIGDLLSMRTAGLVSVERDCLTALGALARAKGDLSGAVTALTRVQNLTQADAKDHSTEFAEVLWLQGQHGLALEQLKRLLRTKNYARPSKPQEFWLRANVLSLLGQWTAEAKQATEIDIREDYFKPSQTAIYHAEKGISAQQMAGVLLRYAQFADQQFQAMSQSEQIKQLKPHHARQMAEYEALCHHRTKAARDDPVVYEALRSLKQECQRDKERLNKHELDRLEFLRVALLTYAKVIATTDSHDNLVLRFCAIWLATESDADTNVYIRKALKDIPSHKFVDLAYQLTARLHPNEESASHFHLNLYALVTRICAEHPFHMAYQVITLAAPAVRSSRRMSTNVGDRERAAFALLAQVRTSTSRSVEIDQLERFAKCAIAWAREDNGKRGKDGYYLPTKDSVILSLRDMVIPVPTANVPTDPTMAYKNIARLRAYEPRFSVAGGIHHPKIMTCWGSDGREYRELFKAGDDTRQDTIMEQLFKLVNDLLDTDSETRRRKLHMRTYNVLTLAEETGVIQFVTQTMPLAEYLMSAHDRYHPDDMKVKEFRESMRLIQSGDDPNRNQKLVETFKENRKRFRPVMRNLFIEKKKEPLSWFAMRLAYSRSLAVSNIVGYIVGIGDRHCSNILIDHSSGEMVHIDFGVAFGQGRALPIPELVPFRLTADLVDALGSFGTQGVYQRCSENTLRVMRNTSEHILAILEVFKHDPLHRWKITAETMKKVQDGLPVQRKSSKSASEIGDRASGHADQALADVINKLDQRMSVEYTVNEWNRNAQAPANLAVIFVGWQPWL